MLPSPSCDWPARHWPPGGPQLLPASDASPHTFDSGHAVSSHAICSQAISSQACFQSGCLLSGLLPVMLLPVRLFPVRAVSSQGCSESCCFQSCCFQSGYFQSGLFPVMLIVMLLYLVMLFPSRMLKCCMQPVYVPHCCTLAVFLEAAVLFLWHKQVGQTGTVHGSQRCQQPSICGSKQLACGPVFPCQFAKSSALLAA